MACDIGLFSRDLILLWILLYLIFCVLFISNDVIKKENPGNILYNKIDSKDSLLEKAHNFAHAKSVESRFIPGAPFYADDIELADELAEKNCVERIPRLSDTSLPLTALVSFPGSGSTWLRHLLQQTTGIHI